MCQNRGWIHDVSLLGIFVPPRILITYNRTCGSHSLKGSITGRRGNMSLKNERSGFFGLVKLAVALAAVILIAAVAVSVMTSEDDDEGQSSTNYVTADGGSASYTPADTSDFITSTVLTIGVGQSKIITPESYLMLSGMSYKSSDTGVATVSNNGGYCTVTGVAVGSATVTCTYGSCTSTCTVTVQSDESESVLDVYDVKEGSSAYATVSGDGFEDGLLSLSFNSASGTYTYRTGLFTVKSVETDYIVINLCGTDSGNWFSSYVTIKMYVTTGDGTIVRNATYSSSPFVPGAQYNTDGGAEILVPTALLRDGTEYSVYFRFYTSDLPIAGYSKQITGSFTYHSSNSGGTDMNGTFARTYSWSYDADHDGTVSDDEEYSASITVPYYIYYMEARTNSSYTSTESYSSGSIFTNRAGDSEYTDTLERVAMSDSVTKSLCEAVVKAYEDNGGTWSSLSSSDKAQFILAFTQINFTYAYDSYQYGDGSTSAEYWAYSTETIWTGAGDCEDTSILTAALFKAAGLKSGVYLVPGHAIAAVALEDYDATAIEIDSNYSGYGVMSKDADGTVYYGCETTAELYLPIGRITQSATVSGTVYNFCDTSASWCELDIIN